MAEKLYLCGPITSNPYYKEEFANAEKVLINAGYEVINPLKLHDREKPWTEYMKTDIKHMLDCYGIALLGNYKTFRGCRLEMLIALQLEIKIAEVEFWVRKELFKYLRI